MNCLNCNKELIKDQVKFCSSSCSAVVTNKLQPKRKRLETSYQKCSYCNVIFYNNHKTTFCSRDCYNIDRKLQSNKSVEQGLIVSSHIIKSYLIEIRGHKCEVCGLTEWCGQKAPLVMDHIDGNSRDNSLSNLRLVCGNCDMQLPTYKSKNKGNGRVHRRVK